MSDVAGWMKRQRESVQSAALFYYRASEGDGIEQVCAFNHEVVTKPVTRQQALQTAKQLIELATRGWQE